MKLIETGIADCYVIDFLSLSDIRGSFNKPYHKTALAELGIDLNIQEQYYSVSSKNVLRGMHFQLPPLAVAKLVTCLSGAIFDAVIDIRKSSPTFMQTYSIRLSKDDKRMIYIPEGLAHGFYSLEDNSTLLYMASGTFSAAHDSGVRWDTVPVTWPAESPIVSPRDQQLVSLHKFDNPF